MMTGKKTFGRLAALLAVLLLTVTMLTFGVSAADGAAAETTAAPAVTTAADTVGAETTAAPAETTAPEGTGDEDDAEDKKLGLGFWISIGVLGALLIAAVIVCIIKREKVGKWLRSIKSELKKVVWMPWVQVRKNTVVVIVVVLALSAVIALLDFAFSKGIIALGSLISL